MLYLGFTWVSLKPENVGVANGVDCGSLKVHIYVLLIFFVSMFAKQIGVTYAFTCCSSEMCVLLMSLIVSHQRQLFYQWI